MLLVIKFLHSVFEVQNSNDQHSRFSHDDVFISGDEQIIKFFFLNFYI